MRSPGVRSNLNLQEIQELRICTYNIRNGGNGRINFALKAMKNMNMTMGFLTKTKLILDTYPTKLHGYNVLATEAKSYHQGGVALFYETTNKSFTLEGTHTFGPNVIRTTLVSGKRQWTLIGAYIPPSEINNDTLNYIQLAIQHEHNHELVLLSDLNVNFNDMNRSNIRQDDTVSLISSLGLQDLRQAFCMKYNSKWTWRQLRDNRYITSECGYILATNLQDFKNIQIKTPNAYESDH
jgi:hypothetical protein